MAKPLGKHEKLLERILIGRAINDIAFDDLRTLLLRLGFQERVRGSHHVFRKQGISTLINIQRDGSRAKPYQVKQVRDVILANQLADEL